MTPIFLLSEAKPGEHVFLKFSHNLPANLSYLTRYRIVEPGKLLRLRDSKVIEVKDQTLTCAIIERL
jgi:hypothetical protein